MNEYDLISMVRQIIQRELVPMIMGQMVSNQTATRSTVKRFANETPRPNTRVLLPYGFASKATSDTQAFLAPGGNDPTNQNVIGQLDPQRPNVGEGESCLYNAYGQAIIVSNGKIQVGTASSTENMVLGQQLKMLLTQLLGYLEVHTHPGIGVPPSNASDFAALKSDIEVILSKISFTE